MNAMKLMRIAAGAAIFFAFLWISFGRIDSDFWWHLKIGEWVLSEGVAPRTDLWSATMPGHEWVDHEWLLEGFMAFAWDRFGWGALAALFALIASLPFFLWIRRSRGAIELAFLGLAALFVSDFIGVRPQTVTFAFFVVLYEFIAKRRFFFIFPLFLLWGNLHAGFFSGFMLMGIIGLVRFVSAAREAGVGRAARASGKFAAVFLASMLATFINPYGARLYGEIFSVAFSPFVGRYVIEWQSILRVPFFASWAAFLGILGFLLISFWRAYPLDLRTVFLVFFAGFLKSAKLGPLFLASAVPLAYEGLRKAGGAIAASSALSPAFAKWGVRAALGASLIWLFGTAVSYERAPFPERAVAFLRSEAAEGGMPRLFHEYRWGGYLLYAAPELKTFIDGRMPHWRSESGPSSMEDYIAVFFGERGVWREVFARRDIDTVLLPQGVSGRPFNEAERAQRFSFWFGRRANDLRSVLRQAGWTVAYEDAVAVVLRCHASACGN